MTIANVEMAAAWDGEEGEHWALHAERYESIAQPHLRALLDGVGIGPDDRVLDVGCGTGRSSREAARIAAGGSVLGVDLSRAMLERARELARREGVSNAAFQAADAQVHAFPDAAFDVAVSAFGAMFFADPVAAFSNLRRALRPGGRLGVLAWRELHYNEWLVEIRTALAAGRTLPSPPPGVPGPFGLADAGHVEEVLGRAGFDDVLLDQVDEPVKLGDGVGDAFEFVSTFGITRGLLQGLDDPSRAAALDALRRTLSAHDTGSGVLFGSSAWRITARAGRAGT